jgi:hypothetical protein
VVNPLQQVTIYPNPVTTQLMIGNAPIGSAITLFNVIGQQVYSGTTTNDRQTIDMHTLPPGNYIIRLTGADGNRMSRVIVKE